MAEVEVETLRSLARRVQRLLPCWQGPAKFFEEKSDVVAELRRLARKQSIAQVDDE